MQPIDAGFLLFESPQKPLHVGGLQIFEPPEGAGPDHVRDLYEQSLTHREVRPAFARKPVEVLGVGPLAWTYETELDFEYHVRHSALPRPGRIRELLELVSRLHGTPLDRTRPLWEMHLIEGLADGRFAVYTKIHHAVVDGVAAMRILQEGLSPDPDERNMAPPWVSRHQDAPSQTQDRAGSGSTAASVRNLLAAPLETIGVARRMATTAWEGVTQQSAALPFRAPRTMFNRNISGARRFAGDSWPLERLQRVADAVDGTVNDVVLAMSAGALRRYLIGHDALPDDSLVAMVPVSMREDEGDVDEDGNAVGIVLVVLGTHLADPVERFDLILESMGRAKAQLSGLSTTQAMAVNVLPVAPFLFTSGLRIPEITRPPFNVVISNVPGPQAPLYWNGARLQGNYPLSIPVDGLALNITCASYAGEMAFGLVGCRRTVPSLQRLLDGLEASLTELEDALT